LAVRFEAPPEGSPICRVFSEQISPRFVVRREATKTFPAVLSPNRQTISDVSTFRGTAKLLTNVGASHHCLVSTAPMRTRRACINMLLCIRDEN
jgi:hypothetical protein